MLGVFKHHNSIWDHDEGRTNREIASELSHQVYHNCSNGPLPCQFCDKQQLVFLGKLHFSRGEDGKRFAWHCLVAMSSRILLVEDDLATLNNLSSLLREEGYEVAEAGDGGQAFKLLERNRFDLVLSDVVMPGANGFDVLDRVRCVSPSTPVILMSGDFNLLELNMPARGATDRLLKPLELAVLLQKVQQALKASRP